MTRLWYVILLAGLWYGLGSAGVCAAPPLDAVPTPPPEPILYRQHLMAEELIAEQGAGYLPMRRATFEAAVQDRSRATPHVTSARIHRASYRARLIGDDTLSGVAEFEVSRSGDAPAVLSLSRCGLALGKPRWQEDANAEPRIGTFPGGDFIAVVDRNGILEFPWNLRATRAKTGEPEYLLRLPVCPLSRIRLELPAAMAPIAPQAIVQPSAEEPNNPLTRTWMLDVGSQQELVLRIATETATAARPALVYVRESLAYRLTTSGMELLASFRMDIHRQPVHQLLLEVAPTIQIAAARLGDKSATIERLADSGGNGQYRISFPEAEQGNDLELAVTAVGPVVTDRDWQLPTIRLMDTEWQTGNATLEIVEPLSLVSLQRRDCVGREVEPLPLPQRGELRQYQCFSPDRGWDIRLAVNVHELIAETGLTLRFTESVLSGQLVADVQSLRGEPFELRGVIQQGWIIDSVQTDPPDILEGFRTEGGGAQQTLRIRLKQAIRSDRKTRLIVRGHRRNPISNRGSTLASMRFFRLQDIALRNGIVALAVEPPLRLAITADQHAVRLDPQRLSLSEANRINAPQNSDIFRDGPAISAMSVAVSPEQPRYSAQIDVEARVESQSITQAYEIQITPERSHVARVVVRFSQASSVAPAWTWADNPGNLLSARRLDSPAATSGQELWELVALRPLNVPFTIRAVRKAKFASDTPLALASIPEASSQSGTLRVVAADGTPLEINIRNVKAISTGRLAGEEIHMIRGVYRYAPSQDAGIRLTRSSSESARAPAWIWLCQLSSRVSGSGELRHEATLFLENKELSSLAIRLPDQASFVGTSVDNVEVDPESREADGSLIIPLPRGRRFPTVSLTFVTKQRPFAFATSLQSMWPSSDLICLYRRWNVWIPPGFVGTHAANASQSLTWDQRLFGIPIVRRSDSIFNPFSFSHWRSLTEGSASKNRGQLAADRVNNYGLSSAKPWAQPVAHVGADEAESGWDCYVVNLSSRDETNIWIYSRSIVEGCGWALLLVTFAVLVWMGVANRGKLSGVLVVSAALLLVAPAECLPLLRGVFLGASLAFVISLLPRRMSSVGIPSVPVSWSEFRSDPRTTATISALVCLACWSLSKDVFAQTRADMPPGPAGRKLVVNPILVPVDDQQKPIGEYVYVPKALFDELHRRAAEATGGATGPLIAGAHYHVELASPNDLINRVSLRSLVAEYELQEILPNARLRLPIRRDRVRVSDARLDGQSIPFEWDESGQWLTLTIEKLESRLLVLNLRPVATDDTALGFGIPIPAVQRSRVTLRSNSNLDDVDIPTALGSIERGTAGEITAELGPVSELRVSWGSSAVPPLINGDTEVAELLWMNIQPNSVVVRAKFKYTLREAGLDRVEIEADPQLRLLPLVGEQPLRVEETYADGIRLIRCHLDEPSKQQVSVELSFALTSNIGNFKLPRLSARAARHAPVWLAVTVADGLTADIVPREKASPITPADFLRVWNQDVESPLLAVALPNEDVMWQLAVRPRAEQIAADQELEISLGHGQAAIAYESLFRVEQGSTLQQRFRVPETFEPRDIIVIHDDVNRLLRWARVDRRTLTVFFSTPLTGSFRVWIKGEMPIPRTSRFEIPLPAAEGSQEKLIPVNRVRLFHQNDLQVQVQPSPGLAPDPQVATPRLRSGGGRYLTSLVAQPAEPETEPTAVLDLAANRPRLQGTMVTSLVYRTDAWWAETSVHLQVRNGYVDTVRMRLPAILEQPSEVTPAAEIDELNIPGEGDRQLLIHLAAPQNSDINLHLRSRLLPPEGDAVHAPAVQLLDVTELQRFMVLPKLMDRRPLAWDTSGLQAADLPSTHEIPVEIRAAADVYQIVGPHMNAALKPVERIAGSPQVHLAEYYFHWFSDRQCLGMAAFDVESSGLSELNLLVPDGLRLVHVAVGGISVAPTSANNQIWRIPVALDHLPQRIEVIFFGALGESKSSSELIAFAAPFLADLPCSQTLWTVQGPTEAGAGVPLLGHTHTDAVDLAKRRLETARKLLRSVTGNMARESSGDAEVWRTGWEDWIRQLEREVTQSTSRVVDQPTISSRETVAAAPFSPRYDFSGLWNVPAADGTSTVHGAFRGQASRFVVRYPGRTWREMWVRIMSAVIMIGSVGIARRVPRSTWVKNITLRYPQLAVGLTGVVWWLWFVPSVLGLVILVLAVLIAMRPAWKTKSV